MFQPEKMRKASVACEGLCKWCIAIERYNKVYKAILPLREKLAIAEEKLEIAQK